MEVHFPEEEMQKNHKHFNTYSASLVIREMQTKDMTHNFSLSDKNFSLTMTYWESLEQQIFHKLLVEVQTL